MPSVPRRDFHLRKATAEDASSIARLKVLCWQVCYSGLMPQPALDGLDAKAETPHWRSWLADEEGGLIARILFVEETPIGYGLAGPMRLGDRPGDEIEADGEIYALYIHPDYLRAGHGGTLMASLVGEMIHQEYRKAGLWMVGGNKPAEGFFRKYSGAETGKRVEIHHGRIAFREKGWIWHDLKKLHAKLNIHVM